MQDIQIIKAKKRGFLSEQDTKKKKKKKKKRKSKPNFLWGPFGLSLFLLKLKIKTKNAVAK